MEVDYRALLAKYIRHLKFLGEETLLDEASILDSMVEFSEEELEVLAEFDYE